MKKPTYDVAIDAMRTVSILAVILIHTSTKILQFGQDDLITLPVAIFSNQISRFAVPLFFMISGFVLELNHKDESYAAYLSRRVKKIFVPYVVWSLIYSLWVYPQDLSNLPRLILYGGASYQLYFIPAIVVFYLIFPILHRLISFISNKWVMISLLTIQMWFLFRDYYIKPLAFEELVRIPTLAFWVFLLGMVAAKNLTKMKILVEKFRWWLTGIMILMAGYVFWEGRSGFLRTHNYFLYYSQWRPSTLIYTSAVAGSLYYWLGKLKRWSNVVSEMSKLSFFVFFVHILVLELTIKYLGGETMNDLTLFLTVTITSFVLGSAVHRIGKLKWLTG